MKKRMFRVWWKIKSVRGREIWHIKWFADNGERSRWMDYMVGKHKGDFRWTDGPRVNVKQFLG